jgi:hypothetical protein
MTACINPPSLKVGSYVFLWVSKVGLCASWMAVSEYKEVGLVEMCTPSILSGSFILILGIVHLSNGCSARTEKQIEALCI